MNETRAREYAQRQADETGRPMLVLRFNPYETLCVVREYSERAHKSVAFVALATPSIAA